MENLCKASGCRAACCRNIEGRSAGRGEFFLKAFPQAQKLQTQDELREKLFNNENGVYYVEERGWVYFAISGDCPNLNSDSNCNIYGANFYPAQCINMILGSEDCKSARIVHAINMRVLEGFQK